MQVTCQQLKCMQCHVEGHKQDTIVLKPDKLAKTTLAIAEESSLWPSLSWPSTALSKTLDNRHFRFACNPHINGAVLELPVAINSQVKAATITTTTTNSNYNNCSLLFQCVCGSDNWVCLHPWHIIEMTSCSKRTRLVWLILCKH